MKKIKKLLIANRGEIAIRILRSCRELGIETVSVYSDVDEDSLHVKLADESVCIGPALAKESYLNQHSILSAADITEADAIHPGYGFLSENAVFAERCAKAGIIFVGPSASIISLMGDKIRSKEMAKAANVPVLETVIIENELTPEQEMAILKIGFPVIIKASAGGGGRGIKVVSSIDECRPAIKLMRAEANAAFGNPLLFVEKYIESPRHIEVQIIADQFGNIIHLGERDCSLQRKFQKIIEEAPSLIDSSLQAKLYECAISLAKYVQYDSVGTIEFIYDQKEKKFYFMEMNTRVQVEHPVTEFITSVDIVATQIKIAQGEKLSLTQDQIHFQGHSIECRINAEDARTFRPSPGHITHYHRPAGFGVRVDDFVYTGYSVKPFYDSMISKVIVKGQTREEARIRMLRALKEMVVAGISTNIALHEQVLQDERFINNEYSTKFLEELMKERI
jgi:acetyl-CoA carboxylase biotin carboxylase subunit